MFGSPYNTLYWYPPFTVGKIPNPFYISPQTEIPPLELGGQTYQFFVCQFNFVNSEQSSPLSRGVPILRPLLGPYDTFGDAEESRKKIIGAGETVVVPLPGYLFR